MTAHNFFAGEATHHTGERIRRFRPTGRLITHHKGAQPNPVKRESGGGLSARLFVGLNVGQVKKYTPKSVVDIVWAVRKKQKKSADASILSQKGIYEDKKGKRVVEPSVQVILIDFSGATKRAWTAEMVELAETLVTKLHQEAVILEIQRRGVVTDVFTIT